MTELSYTVTPATVLLLWQFYFNSFACTGFFVNSWQWNFVSNSSSDWQCCIPCMVVFIDDILGA
jgi:hypothetical protein